MSTASSGSAAVAAAAAAAGNAPVQAILQDPMWPSIPGKGKWAALPPELQGFFATMEDDIYKASINWWLSLIIIGALGFDTLASLPSDIRFVFWPEIQRVFDLQNPDKSSRKWKTPHTIILAHFFARLLVAPYVGTICHYYSAPSNCAAALQGMLCVVALITINGQVMLTLRSVAISRCVPYHRFAWTLLVVGNLAVTVIIFMFAFGTSSTTLPSTQPFGFRSGFRCTPPVSKTWIPTTFYAICFALDSLMFLLALIALNSTFIPPGPSSSGPRRKRKTVRTMRSMFKYTVFCLLGMEHRYLDGVPDIAATFIADGARYLIIAWILEGVGIIFAVVFVLDRETPDQLKMAWVLPFHALVYSALVPKTVVSLKRVVWIERMIATKLNTGDPMISNPFDSDPRTGPRPKENPGIAIRSVVVQHRMEDVEPTISADTFPDGGAFATYRPNLVETVQDCPQFSASFLSREKDKDSTADLGSFNAPPTTEGLSLGNEYPPPGHNLIFSS